MKHRKLVKQENIAAESHAAFNVSNIGHEIFLTEENLGTEDFYPPPPLKVRQYLLIFFAVRWVL